MDNGHYVWFRLSQNDYLTEIHGPFDHPDEAEADISVASEGDEAEVDDGDEIVIAKVVMKGVATKTLRVDWEE